MKSRLMEFYTTVVMNIRHPLLNVSLKCFHLKLKHITMECLEFH